MTVEQLKAKAKDAYSKIIYQLTRTNLTTAYALQLTGLEVVVEDDETFKLNGYTFAYYDPVDRTIHVNIQDPFFSSAAAAQKLEEKLSFILLHEISHHLFLHDVRKGTRDHQLFNVASDFEIHNMLSMVCRLAENENNSRLRSYCAEMSAMFSDWNRKDFKPSRDAGEIDGCYCEDYNEFTAEEIYEKLLASKKVEEETMTMQFGGSGSGAPRGSSGDDASSGQKAGEGDGGGQGGQVVEGKVTKTTYELPNGKKITTVSVELPRLAQGQSQKDSDKTSINRQMLGEELQKSMEKAKGSVPAHMKEFLRKLFKVKIDWEKILKSSLQTILAPSDYFTWRRPRVSTLSLGMYLPAVEQDISAYGTLIVVRDESGSISSTDLEKAAGVIADAKEYYKTIMLIKHDTSISTVDEFDELDERAMNAICERTAAGGTSHKEVFEYVTKYYLDHRYDDEKSVSCVIFITDCCSDIENYQDGLPAGMPVIYMVPENSIEYAKNVKGKVIAIAD